MKKLKLQIDALVVESFTISSQEAPRGTVRAYNDSTNCSYGSPNVTECIQTCGFPCDGETDQCTLTCT